MKKQLLASTAIAAFVLSGCLGKDDDKDGSSYTFPNFTVNVTCTEDGTDPTNCTDEVGEGRPVFFAIGVDCNSLDNVSVTTAGSSNLSCEENTGGVDDTCDGSSAGLTWETENGGPPSLSGTSFGVAAWLDIDNTGYPEGPDAGDVLCCLDSVTISEGGTINIPDTGCVDADDVDDVSGN